MVMSSVPIDPKTLPKVLYVEDTLESRLLVQRLLSHAFVVLEAKDALSGIELALDTHPDLILLDINLPDLSGREIAARLRSLLPDTPLVALTADTSPGARERALAAGFWGFLTKPIVIDTFEEQIRAYLQGKRETLPDSARYVQLFQAEIVERLETKVRELSKIADRNQFLHEHNQVIIAELQRRQRLLEGAARVVHNIASILDLQALLRTTVDIICEEYEFYYAGIFFIDDARQWLVLKAGRGAAGAAMLKNDFRLPINSHSMVGRAVVDRKAHIALDVDQEPGRFRNPLLFETRSEVSLPLIVKEHVLGALTVQSQQLNAFSEDDLTALQVLADQVAIAIQNAQLLEDLDAANRELLRQTTFEAIATAAGEAIHWVGNKAAPVMPAAERVREDIVDLIAVVEALLELPDDQRTAAPYWRIWQAALQEVQAQGLDLKKRATRLASLSERQLQSFGGLGSILEDLDIISRSADVILSIKEDMIGPARLAHPDLLYLEPFLQEVVTGMAWPPGVVQTDFAPNLPPVYADARQMGNVFNNLLKNAWEALEGRPDPTIWVSAFPARDPDFVQIQVKDNGPGIPPDMLDKIWVSFFTTKAGRGGTGLGLFSCMEIVRQAGGNIWVQSQPGDGATFFVVLPIAQVAG
jgi:signal transduction histidine kinase/CheY-like chemotaxis protein